MYPVARGPGYVYIRNSHGGGDVFGATCSLRCLLGEGPIQLDSFQDIQFRSLRACPDCTAP